LALLANTSTTRLKINLSVILLTGFRITGGSWEKWHPPEVEVVKSCTIITTEANELMNGLQQKPTEDSPWAQENM
jgi:hypothetical protein